MAFYGYQFGQMRSGEGRLGYGLGSRRGMRPKPPRLGQAPPVYRTPSLGSYTPQSSQNLGSPSLGNTNSYQTPAPQTQAPESATPAATDVNSQPLDPFGTQASGGQYGNLSGTPAIFGASTYAPTPYAGPTNTPEKLAMLEKIKQATPGLGQSAPVDFAAEKARADAIRAQYAQGNSVAGHAQLQTGATVGGNQWNGTSWQPFNYQQQVGFFGGSNPGGY